MSSPEHLNDLMRRWYERAGGQAAPRAGTAATNFTLASDEMLTRVFAYNRDAAASSGVTIFVPGYGEFAHTVRAGREWTWPVTSRVLGAILTIGPSLDWFVEVVDLQP